VRDPHDILIKPIITEKSVAGHPDMRYTFQVKLDANKIEIKQAVESIFGVQVDRVRTMRVPGKPRRYGIHTGYTSDWKKAIVILKKTSRPIGFFEGI